MTSIKDKGAGAGVEAAGAVWALTTAAAKTEATARTSRREDRSSFMGSIFLRDEQRTRKR